MKKKKKKKTNLYMKKCVYILGTSKGPVKFNRSEKLKMDNLYGNLYFFEI